MNMKEAEPIRKPDVLIIGAGIGGCSAAYAAAKAGLDVLLITSQNDLSINSSSEAQGGIIYKAKKESFEDFLADFQRATDGTVNEKAVYQIYRYGPKLVEDILINDLNVPFNREESGEISLTREAAHSNHRVAYAQDYTGKAIQDCFYKKLKSIANIEILTGVTAVDLITLAHHSLDYTHIYEPSTCSGAYVLFQDREEVYPILSRWTILATGGLGRLYLHTSNPVSARGDGYAMAYRAGARIMNMEYVQFHPTTLFTANDERFLITEAIRGEGGILRNKYGEDFMKSYHELGDLAPRDVVARSIIQEINKTESQYVYLDITHKEADWIRSRFPSIYKKCLDFKIDITKEWVPVVPAAHYECGGIAVDSFSNTTIKRLKAVGEVSCTGLHGANRLASSSLLEGLVYGTIAGRDCAEKIGKEKCIIPKVPPWKAEFEPVDSDLLRQDRLTVQHTMWNYVGIMRTRKKLDRAFGILWKLQQDIENFYVNGKLNDNLIGLRNAATSSLLVLYAARLNKVSRGCHYRVD